MTREIILFLQTKEFVQRDTESLEHTQSTRRHSLGGDDELLITSIDRWLSDDDKKAKELVEDFAESQHLELIVYDCAKFWDNLRAKFKGIKITPTVILGTHRFTTDITREQLEKMLIMDSKNT